MGQQQWQPNAQRSPYEGNQNVGNYNPYPDMNNNHNNGYNPILANPTYRRDDMMRNNNENFDSDKD